MREHLQRRRQMDDVVTLKEAESRNRGIEIEAGRKSCAERQTKCLQRIHNLQWYSAGEDSVTAQTRLPLR